MSAPHPEATAQGWRILGHQPQLVELTLAPGDGCYAEVSSLLYADAGIEMRTLFRDGSSAVSSPTLIDRVVQASRRFLSGEGLAVTVFWNGSSAPQKVAFAAASEGQLLPLDLRAHGGSLIVQRDCFVCASRHVTISVALSRRIAGVIAGDELLLQRFDGVGTVVIGGGGMLLERQLGQGEVLRVEPTTLVAVEASVGFELQTAPYVNLNTTGEELVVAQLRGPGRLWIQTHAPRRVALRARSGPFLGGNQSGAPPRT